jgi:hypothetical protein
MMRNGQQAGGDALSAVTQRHTKVPFGDGVSGVPESRMGVPPPEGHRKFDAYARKTGYAVNFL